MHFVLLSTRNYIIIQCRSSGSWIVAKHQPLSDSRKEHWYRRFSQDTGSILVQYSCMHRSIPRWEHPGCSFPWSSCCLAQTAHREGSSFECAGVDNLPSSLYGGLIQSLESTRSENLSGINRTLITTGKSAIAFSPANKKYTAKRTRNTKRINALLFVRR